MVKGSAARALASVAHSIASMTPARIAVQRMRKPYAPSSSTSNTSVAFGGITPPAPRAP